MKERNWRPYAFWVVFTEMAGGLSGWLTRDGMELYRTAIVKPPLSPPGIVFPIVWTILFALMGVGAARIYLSPASGGRSRALGVFLLQLAFNFFWSILFFDLQRFGLALLWLAVLCLLILWMVLAFHKIDPPSAWLQVPYLLWAVFAAYLNFGVWRLNG